MRCLWPIALLLTITSAGGPAATCFAQSQQEQQPEVIPPPASQMPVIPPVAPATGTTLGARIATLLRDPKVARAHWGIALTTLSGAPIYSLDEDKLFHPASTAKLFTTAAAMALLGPDATTHATVALPTPSPEGLVTGDLTVWAEDDANLAFRGQRSMASPASPAMGARPDPLQAVNDFAEEIAAKGVRHITGDVVALDAPWDPYPQGWEADDLVWGYGAPVTSLSVNDNQLLVTVTGAVTEGQPATAALLPDTGFYRVVSTVKTAATGTADSITVHHTPGDGTLRLSGSIAVGKRYTAELAVDDPPAFAARALRQALLAKGVTVDGIARAPHEEIDTSGFLHEARLPLPRGLGRISAGDVYGPPRIVLKHTSAPLAEDIADTLKHSLNLHAELMLRRLRDAPGLPISDEVPPAAEGARVEHQWLVDAGISDREFLLYDGSGLSTKDLVTPHAEAQLLAFAARQPWFAQWKAALPIGGVDGTLRSRFTEPPLKGHVFAKTGTLGESRALAGYLLCASGREVIFSILVDNHEPGSSADRVAMDKIVETIAATN